jgi:phosphatidylglycerophosphate synthase
MRISLAEVRSKGQDHPHLQADPTYSRLVMRRLSPAVTWAIVRGTPFSADAVTGLAIASGLAAAALVLAATPPAYIAAALLLQLAYLFDTVDGEVARVRGTAGKRGTYLDLIGHVLQNRALYAAGSVELLRATATAPWALVAVMAGLALASPFGEQARAQTLGASVNLPSAHGAARVEARPAGGSLAAQLYWAYRRVAFLWAYPASMNLFCIALGIDAALLAVGAERAPTALPALTAAFLVTLAVKQLANAIKLLDRRHWTGPG